jgi:AcrR family transcriptional regulator
MDKTTVLKTKGERTREAILTTAADLATKEGLEPLSIGRLAEATGMSKSGLFAHFGSKEELQIATAEYAASVFVEEVVAPARAAPKGLPRVWALCDHKLGYLERQVFPGGCFFASTSVEFSHRPGPVRDRIEQLLRSWLSYLEHAVEQAQQSGELDDSLSAREITFELDSFAMAANWQYQMFGDRTVFDGARRATRERLESLRRRQAA